MPPLSFLLGLNRLFPRRWRWTVKRLLRLPSGQLGHQLDEIDFRTGPRLILDVGANRGNFATNVLLKSPLAEVHCFEPNPEIFPLLEAQCARLGREAGRPRAVAFPCGVGAVAGELELQVLAFDAASSFLPVTPDAEQGFSAVDFTLRRRVRVPIVTLEQHAARTNAAGAKLLKIDVQGFELEVLKGCGAFLERIEHILVEVQFLPLYQGAPVWNEILAYLCRLGFRPLSMAQFCVTGGGSPLQADLLFKNSLT
jgi:FkbM family methyltransferase